MSQSTRTGPPDQGPMLLPLHVASSDDLTWQALQGKNQRFPYEGIREAESVFEGLSRALHRRTFPNALLVGEKGVGKSTLIAEFARRATQPNSGFLKAKRFLAVDCRFVPPDEARTRLLAVLGHSVPHEHLVICLDGLHGLLHPASGGSQKPVLYSALAQARCHIIAQLTPLEFDDLAGDDPEFMEFFTKIEVAEADPTTALVLLRHFAQGLSMRYGVTVEPEAIEKAVTLTSNYILNDQLPAKALRVLTQACEEAEYDRKELGRTKVNVTEDDIFRAVSLKTGIPENTLRGLADKTDYAQALGEVIFGQEHAIREIATELGLIKAGMTDPTKPASVLLFLGQTGTGKTELAKALARFYSSSKRLKTYTLGNCVEPHSVSTIIGVPPGYVGSDRGGRLITELNADPYGVFLLDEADKAHPDVLQPFLNLFDEGWVTDQRGARGSGTKGIFVMTTNVGQRMIVDMYKEGKSIAEITTRMKEALSQIRHAKSERPVFTPEFLARVKRIIVFKPLDQAAMIQIARKQLADLRESWAQTRSKLLEFPDTLQEYIGSAANQLDVNSNGKEGGRVVRKLIAEWIEAPLQRAMAENPERFKGAKSVKLGLTTPLQAAETPPSYPDPCITVAFI